MIELYVWISTLFFTAAAHFALSFKHSSVNPTRSVMPVKNSRFYARLAITNGINYFIFGCLAIFGIFNYSKFLPEAIEILNQWWIVEAFIFWNLRTTFLILLGLRETKVEI